MTSIIEPSLEQAAPRLEAAGLSLRVEAATLLRDLSLRAGQGEFLGVIGPNGAGKTTLLRTISGLLSPTSGAVRLEGRDLRRLSAREVARVVAQVPQHTVLDFGFQSLEMVLMGRHPHLGRFRLEGKEDYRIAAEAMAATSTLPFAERPFTTLSGGERQRLLIARALAQEPRLLLLDEPTANLDLHHQLQIMELMRGLVGRGITAIAAIHDLNLAARYCDRLLLLHQGRLVKEGRPWEVLTPELLETVYGIQALVYTDPVTGVLSLQVLAPQLQSVPREAKGWVHVIAGGGRGAKVLYELYQAGCRVTTGVLNEGDSDWLTARRLGLEMVAVPAFAPIDDASYQRNLELVRQADSVLVCDICVGPGNLRNLEAAEAARSLVFLLGQPMVDRDFTGGKATALCQRFAARALLVEPASLVKEIQGLWERSRNSI